MSKKAGATKKMKQIEKIELTPRLRFPEFQNSGDWEVKKLERLFTIGNGKDYKHLTAGNVPVYGSGGYMLSVDSYLHDGESVCIGRKGTINNPIFLTGKFWAVDTLFYTHSFRDCLPRFIYGIFQNINWLDHNETGGIPSLSKANIGEIEVALPAREEQKKIGDCLFSLDKLIALETEKLNTLKSFKKGIMQNIFPVEGETLPNLRFPEFHDAGAWEEKLAGTLFANRTKVGEAGLPIYSVTTNDGMVKRSLLERNVNDIAEPSGNKKAYKDDIAYNMMRMWQGAFGVASEDCMVSPAYVVLAPRDGVYSDFFGYLLKLPKYLRLLTSHSQGLTLDRLRLYYKDFARIPLSCPTLPEQKKIVEFLTSTDGQIVGQNKKLKALKEYKKGFMRQLYPTSYEFQV